MKDYSIWIYLGQLFWFLVLMAGLAAYDHKSLKDERRIRSLEAQLTEAERKLKYFESPYRN